MAECEGYVHYYYDGTPRNNGYGGREIELTMVDGTKKILKGPWSSNATAVSKQVGELDCIECYYRQQHPSKVLFRGGSCYGIPAAITWEKLKPAFEQFYPDVTFVKHSYSKKYEKWCWSWNIVCKDGRPKPFAPINPDIVKAIESQEIVYFDYPRKMNK